MKKKGEVLSIIFTGVCIVFLYSCNNKSEKVKVVSEDSTIVMQPMDSVNTPPYSTASLLNWKEYFRKNNKYKNWDAKNHQQVFIKAVVEKDGTINDVKIIKKCEDELLNKEALRLIRDAKTNGAQIEPARNENGDSIRSSWIIVVNFPAK